MQSFSSKGAAASDLAKKLSKIENSVKRFVNVPHNREHILMALKVFSGVKFFAASTKTILSYILRMR